MKPKLCMLSTDSLDGFVCDDDHAIPALEDSGWRVDTLSWRARNVDWDDYALVVVRSTWDYQAEVEGFLEVLRVIDTSNAVLANPLAAMVWNLDKRYLVDLAAAGIDVVPTEVGSGLSATRLDELIGRMGPSGLVMKPAVGANADHTYRLASRPNPRLRERVLASHRDRRWLAQPFLTSILDEGEFSVFFFAGEYSHCILKTPRSGDFRVQEEHGGRIRTAKPDRSLISAADAVLKAVPGPLLYARIDLARGPDGNFLLMEVELIEPSLYFRMDATAPNKFAAAVNRWLQAVNKSP